jgi:hypothetical protein
MKKKKLKNVRKNLKCTYVYYIAYIDKDCDLLHDTCLLVREYPMTKLQLS